VGSCSRGAALALLTVLLSFGSMVFGGGWRYPYETCQWAVKATAIEMWTTTQTEYTRIEAHASAIPDFWQPDVSDSDSAEATATVRGNVGWYTNLEVRRAGVTGGWAEVSVSVNGQVVVSAAVGGSWGDPGDGSGGFAVSPGDRVAIFALAVSYYMDGVPDNASWADVTADVPRLVTVEHRTTVTAVAGPYFGTINKGEGVKTIGTFPIALAPQHGGTLSPTTYTLVNVVPPPHGLVWIDPTSATVFAQTTYRIRTWDLIVLSRNLQFGAQVGVWPPDNNFYTTGTVPFIRVFDEGTTVVLTAPSWAERRPFSHWEDAAGTTIGLSVALTVVMNSDEMLTAVYGTADTAGPRLASVVAWDYDQVQVIFNEPVQNADEPTNYTCTAGLTILAATRLTDLEYRLRTSPQQAGTSYTLTAKSAICDPAGNPIDPAYCSLSFTGSVRLSVATWRHYR